MALIDRRRHMASLKEFPLTPKLLGLNCRGSDGRLHRVDASGEKPGSGRFGWGQRSLTYLAKVMQGSCKRAQSRKWEV